MAEGEATPASWMSGSTRTGRGVVEIDGKVSSVGSISSRHLVTVLHSGQLLGKGKEEDARSIPLPSCALEDQARSQKRQIDPQGIVVECRDSAHPFIQC